MRFVPFDWKAFRLHQEEQRRKGPVPGMADTTAAVGKLIFDNLAIAADVDPQAGTVSFRDENGVVWQLCIARGDVDELRGEFDLRTRSK